MINIPNYQITKQIYESANSLVYRALRDEDNQAVILKVLKEDYPTPEELTRYRQEYDITRHLADLEGVVKAYSLEKHQNTLVICLEDFGGKSLKIWLDEQRTFTLDELLTFAIRATEILGQIHGQNIIHKDINTANLVLNPNTGVLKMIDFGISTQLSRQHLTLKNPDVLEGTLAYMSPEQTGRMNRALDYRTDFYSLGATFYELFTGKLPFESKDAMELVHCHIAKQAMPPHQMNPELPIDISNIILKLLEKNAEDRYQSPWGIKADLEECQLQLANTGQINPFTLAQQDISDRFQIPPKLYGRESEIKTLLTAFERVTQANVEMMLVGGYSGIGKSVLVKEIYKSLTEKRGYFIAGKFDQFQRNIPYSAVVNAFKELAQLLLTEKEEQFAVWKDKLLTALGPNGQVIIDVIPEMELIIGPQPLVPTLGPTESQNRFNLVFQNFIRVFSQPEHPLVVFLDDLQWADLATLKLLEVIMTDKDTEALFLIGAYRDNEVDSAHPFMMTLDKLGKENVTINQITLKALAFEHINQLLVDSLLQDQTTVESLTALVIDKTGGNPFFVNQFLRTLYEENLLHFVPPTMSKKGGWQWDVAQIEAMNITDNVVDLMIGKLRKLPELAQHVIRLAACVGNRFDLETLAIIYEKSVPDSFQDMMPALKEGLILPTSELEIHGEDIRNSKFAIQHFQFLHDRVQQAAYALIDKAQKQSVHLQIGRLLLANTTSETLEERIFDIVEQINQALKLVTAQTEKTKISELNLKAGQKAKLATAYQAAIDYFAVGIQLLGSSLWEQHYSQAFELHKEQGECEFLLGHFNRSEQLLSLALEKAQSKFDKVDVYAIKIVQKSGQGEYHEAISAMIEGVNMFGLQVPTLAQTEIQKEATAAEMSLYYANMKNRQIEDLWHLPLMQDEEMKACSKLIAIALDSFAVGIPHLLDYYATKMVNMSIQYGLSLFTPVGYSFFAVVLSRRKDYNGVYKFADLGRRLNLEKLINSSINAKTYLIYAFYVLLRKHVSVGVEYFQTDYRVALDNGDFVYAGYTMIDIPRFTLPSGVDKALKATQESIIYANKVNNLPTLLIGQMHEGFINNLQGDMSNMSFSHGQFTEAMVIDAFEEKAPLLFAIYKNVKLMALSLFGHYESALPIVHERVTWLAAFGTLDLLLRSDYTLHTGITCAALYPNASTTEQQEYLEILEECMDENKRLSDECPINFEHAYLILQAEHARIKNQPMTAIKLYDQAITSARKYDFWCNEALANELAAKFWLAQGKEKFAHIYLKGAHYAYQQWGAPTKVKDLETRYPHLLAHQTARPLQTETTILATTTKMASSTSHNTSNWLDLNSVMKASQTLSGEIVLRRLLEKMMHIVIENAGASIGFLLLPQQDNWFIEAQGQVDRSETTVLQSLALEESEQVSANIIHYVARTQDNVVLHDATIEGNFTHDPHIVKQRPKSVLSTALINQGKLTGILYLENHLTTGAFTNDRLETLNLLSSQIAISIENSLLYNNLEQKVTERTQELSQALDHLKTTQAQLVESEKMASLGGLVAGVAHEINTPIGIGLMSASTLTKKTDVAINAFKSNQLKKSTMGAYFDQVNHGSQLILRNLERASELVKSFKQVAVDQSNLEQRSFVVKKYLEEMLVALKPKLQKTHQITLNGDEQVRINSYPGAFSQVITNLLMNSITHAYQEGEEGQLHFDIRGESEQIIIEYSDDGCGIPTEHLPKIFDPFFTTGRAKGGTGLGLHITYNLVTQKLTGTIHVESVVGVGTTFIISLPLAQ